MRSQRQVRLASRVYLPTTSDPLSGVSGQLLSYRNLILPHLVQFCGKSASIRGTFTILVRTAGEDRGRGAGIGLKWRRIEVVASQVNQFHSSGGHLSVMACLRQLRRQAVE